MGDKVQMMKLNLFSINSMKDGAELKEDSRVVVNRDFAPHGSYEITIHKVGDADAGQYTAVATNTVGKEECSCQVSVKGG